MPAAAAPIVVLDSGVGGLTVVRALRAVLPHEQIVYFGDTARVPYGCKSAATVTTFVRQIIHHLLPLEPKHVVIACNTATALALPAIKAEFPQIPVSGVIDPGARAAAEAAGTKLMPLIGVIATEATVRSQAYQHAIHRRRNKARLMVRAAPLLAAIIEEGRSDTDPLVQLALQQYLQPLMECEPDVLVLGCTHYPIYRTLISRMMGSACKVIDSSEQCAEDVARRLRTCGLLRGEISDSSLRCLVTDDPAKFQQTARRFLGVPVEEPTWITLDQLTADSPAPLRRVG